MRPLSIMAAALGASLLLFPVGAAGQARTGTIAPLTPLGITEAQALRVHRWISSGLSRISGHRWLGASRLRKLLQKSRYRQCRSEPKCLGAVARKLGVDLIVTGEVGSLSGAYMVYLRLSGRDGKLIRSVNGVLDPRKSGVREAVRAMATRLITPREFVGSIKIKVDVKNAWIYLNGRRIARSPTGPLRDIPVGTHALRITHESYRDYVRFIKVEFDQSVTVDVKLSEFLVNASEMKLTDGETSRTLADHEMPWYRRWWAVVGFGAVILAATTATVAVLAGSKVSRDSEMTVRP